MLDKIDTFSSIWKVVTVREEVSKSLCLHLQPVNSAGTSANLETVFLGGKQDNPCSTLTKREQILAIEGDGYSSTIHAGCMGSE